MACGDKYKHLLVTPGGLTPENPCGMLCSGFDYEDWHSVVADRIVKQTTLHWAAAERAALAAGAVQIPINLQEERAAFAQSFDDQPKYWWSIDWSRPLENYKSAINQLVSVGQRGTCLLEQIDNYIVELGGKPPIVPAVPPAPTSIWDTITTIAIVTVVVGGASVGGYYLYKHRKAVAA